MTALVCWLIRRRLGAYRDGELGAVALDKTRAHLLRCDRCPAELESLDRLRSALARAAPEVPEPDWAGFWPGVRERLVASPPPVPWAERVRLPALGAPRFAFGSAVAAVAVAVVALVAPWESPDTRISPPARQVSTVQGPSRVVVQAVETADPNSSVMVFTHREPDVTVVWVFGLERT